MKINTPEQVYNNIYFFTYGNWKEMNNEEEIPELRSFVSDLFDMSKEKIGPFDRIDTMRIRSIYGIGPTIYEDDKSTFEDLFKRLYDYLLINKKPYKK